MLDSRKVRKMEKMKGCYLVDLLGLRKVARLGNRKVMEKALRLG